MSEHLNELRMVHESLIKALYQSLNQSHAQQSIRDHELALISDIALKVRITQDVIRHIEANRPRSPFVTAFTEQLCLRH